MPVVILYRISDGIDLNIYNIYYTCSGLGPNQPTHRITQPHIVWERLKYKLQDSKAELGGEVPCINSSRARLWINQDSVRNAIHAISVAQQPWTICSNNISYSNVYSTVIPIHQELLNAGYRILIYSGDTDMCVPFTGSEAWTQSLKLPLKEEWRPWKVNYQVAGYVKTYEQNGVQFMFATIKGSGHTVPQYKPAQAYHFFKNFLAGQPF